MKTTTALLVLVATASLPVGAFAAPASKSPAYVRGSLASVAAPSASATAPAPLSGQPYVRGSLASASNQTAIAAPSHRSARMSAKNPAFKFTSTVACTTERIADNPACRAHCGM